ncbi:hypothetical protein WA026_012212 [Henosepilachna vigintioctopunctata]|uniref:BTB domain-containing protein n=1 Tax=Henosepilachna vigintioctopunctata TaxID=420089 RepID=A0AAW1VEB4_9CUCU
MSSKKITESLQFRNTLVQKTTFTDKRSRWCAPPGVLCGTNMNEEDKFLVQCTSRQCGNAAQLEVQMIEYLKEAVKAMELMRFHRMLTDVVLEVGSDIFYAHKVVLAAASPYFKAMFTGGLKECDKDNIKLQGVCYLLHRCYR